jgi:hypothetical protein
MQASKGQHGEVRFDCQSCRTTVVERSAAEPAESAKK